jgi:hypothetical protein
MALKDKAVEASVIGSSLVASFNKANPPLVWKFDLERNHSFTIALQGEEGDWELGLTSPKGDFYPVTHFLTREDAEDAFAGVQKALAKKKFSPLWFGLKIVLGLIVLAVLLIFFVPFLVAMHAQNLSHGFRPPMMPPATMEEIPQGVPEPADRFLMRTSPGLPPAAMQPSAPPPPPAREGVPVPADEILKAPH